MNCAASLHKYYYVCIILNPILTYLIIDILHVTYPYTVSAAVYSSHSVHTMISSMECILTVVSHTSSHQLDFAPSRTSRCKLPIHGKSMQVEAPQNTSSLSPLCQQCFCGDYNSVLFTQQKSTLGPTKWFQIVAKNYQI